MVPWSGFQPHRVAGDLPQSACFASASPSRRLAFVLASVNALLMVLKSPHLPVVPAPLQLNRLPAMVRCEPTGGRKASPSSSLLDYSLSQQSMPGLVEARTLCRTRQLIEAQPACGGQLYVTSTWQAKTGSSGIGPAQAPPGHCPQQQAGEWQGLWTILA